MKNRLFCICISVALIASALVLASGCQKKGSNLKSPYGAIGGAISGSTYKTEGWLDEETYRVTMAAVPKQGLTDKDKRRESSQKTAVLLAQARAMDTFAALIYSKPYDSTKRLALAKKIGKYVDDGKAVKVTYDGEDNCEVIYEIKAWGLEKKLQELK